MKKRLRRPPQLSARSFYTVCPVCGANLDPGERCDCCAEPEPPQNKKAVTDGKNP